MHKDAVSGIRRQLTNAKLSLATRAADQNMRQKPALYKASSAQR